MSLKQNGYKVVNIAKPKPVTKNQAHNIAASVVWLQSFRANYNQLCLRVSDSPNGLYQSGQSPIVGA